MKTIAEVMSREYKADISRYEKSFLEKSVEKRLIALNIKSLSSFSELLARDENEAGVFLNSLSVCYSEFFRNSLTFALLEQLILPGLIEEKQANSEIRIWSAACAAGQEPYSIAMLLDDLIRRKEEKSRFRIFGTDVSEKELERARKGVYCLSDVQNIRTGLVMKYFIQKGENYTISDKIKGHVDFSFHDLLDTNYISPASSIFGDFDLVCCSNLLFYYNPDIRQQILNRLYLSLSPGGYLVTGEAERDIVQRHKFIPVAAPSAVFRKRR
ncbi:MAG: CheR family methyltransferase [Bacteroidota bacterium]